MEVCVGHVVVPCEDSQPTSTTVTQEGPDESGRKRQRVEVARARYEPSDDVVVVPALTRESLQEALHRYALQTLTRWHDSKPCSTEYVDSAFVEETRAWCSASSASWPAVISPQQQPPSASVWSTWSFCFVPEVLRCADGTFAGGASCVEERTRRVLAALPLPRSVCFCHGSTPTASGCVTAVLCERAALPTKTAAPTQSAPHRLPSEVTSKPLLLVGAGGIGCEVLKVLVLSGFAHIHVIDLDTIDATNLNRQFLFQVSDVGHSKAETARRVVCEWFDGSPSQTVPQLVAYHDNIKADRFDDAFYQGFSVVLNALDNVSARQHVNRLCMRNGVPLIESGTMGYNGQVQPIVKGQYECYDCRPKPSDTKTFAVCTIHARPTTMVHCVHYAKELYETLFGNPAGGGEARAATAEEAGSEEQQQEQQQQRSKVGGELSYLRAMVSEWRQGSSKEGEASKHPAQLGAQLLHHLFVEKVAELLAMKTAWSTEPPMPLDAAEVQGALTSHTSSAALSAPLSADEVLSLGDCMELFLRAVEDCLSRAAGVAFRKEDDAAVRFVSATANLRAHVFHIVQQSLEEIRSIAGSIVPAIATTNAVIAAAVVHELVALLSSSSLSAASAGDAAPGARPSVGAPRVVYARRAPQMRRRRLPPPPVGPHCLSSSLYTAVDTTSHGEAAVGDAVRVFREGKASPATAQGGRPRSVVDAYLVHSTCPNPPNALHCLVCQDVHPEVVVRLRLATVTLGQLVHTVLEDAVGLEAPCVCHGTTLLYEDEDYESLRAFTLSELLQPPNTAVSATRPHRFVLTADALNKEVAWNVVVVDGGAASTSASAAAEEDEVAFTISGLDRAKEAENRAVARLADQSQQQRENGTAEARGEESAGAVEGAVAEVVITDDEDDEVRVVVAPAEESGAAKPTPAAAVEDKGEDDDDVVVEVN